MPSPCPLWDIGACPSDVRSKRQRGGKMSSRKKCSCPMMPTLVPFCRFTGIIASMYWQNEPNVGNAIHQVIFSRDKARALQGFRDCGQARTDRYMGVPPACHALAGC